MWDRADAGPGGSLPGPQYFRFSFWKSLVLSRGRGRSPKTWVSSASRSTRARMLAAMRSRSGEEGCGDSETGSAPAASPPRSSEPANWATGGPLPALLLLRCPRPEGPSQLHPVLLYIGPSFLTQASPPPRSLPALPVSHSGNSACLLAIRLCAPRSHV